MKLKDALSGMLKKRIDIDGMAEREGALATRPGAIRATDRSPVRFETSHVQCR